jgi:hypothetical protein
VLSKPPLSLAGWARQGTGVCRRAEQAAHGLCQSGQATASPEIKRLVWEASEEAAAVARAECVNLEPGVGDSTLTLLDSFSQKNPCWRPSLLQDLDAERRLDLEDLRDYAQGPTALPSQRSGQHSP